MIGVGEADLMYIKFENIYDEELSVFEDVQVNLNCTKRSACCEIKFEIKIITSWDCESR